jgi:hypothetical protein
MGQLRVQKLTRRDGRRSWTIVWPEGTVHPEADRFLRRHDGSGTQRTYAYLLVDHLRWLDRECLGLDALTLRDLERYMGLVGAEVRMPLGEPRRAGKRPYGRDALSAAAACLKGFYLHQSSLGVNSEHGVGKAAFVAAAEGLERRTGAEEIACRICVKRPAAHNELRLCQRHLARWDLHQRTAGQAADFAQWVSEEQPCFSYGTCVAVVCPNLADSPLGLCSWHGSRYRRDGGPGGASLPGSWWQRYERLGEPVPVGYDDRQAFLSWCSAVSAQPWPGQVNPARAAPAGAG